MRYLLYRQMTLASSVESYRKIGASSLGHNTRMLDIRHRYHSRGMLGGVRDPGGPQQAATVGVRNVWIPQEY